MQSRIETACAPMVHRSYVQSTLMDLLEGRVPPGMATSLAGMGLRDEHMHLLRDAMQPHAAIDVLDLRNNDIGDDGLRVLKELPAKIIYFGGNPGSAAVVHEEHLSGMKTALSSIPFCRKGCRYACVSDGGAERYYIGSVPSESLCMLGADNCDRVKRDAMSFYGTT